MPPDEVVIAMAFQEAYQRLAPKFGCTADSWDDLPDSDKKLMVAVAKDLLVNGRIKLAFPSEA